MPIAECIDHADNSCRDFFGVLLMGAQKQRWTAEEEAALKAGVGKHGVGKWRTILTDPEFNSILRIRSNVDLKDKWRNINVTANGWGSRHRARFSIKKNQVVPKEDSQPSALSALVQSAEEIIDAEPLAIANGAVRVPGSKDSAARLENLIFEALSNLKEPTGSDKHNIAMYIEEQYWAPPNLKKLLSAKLQFLTANGKLMKVKHKYRITANSKAEGRSTHSPLLAERRQKDLSRTRKSSIHILPKPQIDTELSEAKSMTVVEAAEAAARAVAEAEVAITEAEQAAKEAERAEAEAEAAQIFAEAAMKALKYQILRMCHTTNRFKPVILLVLRSRQGSILSCNVI